MLQKRIDDQPSISPEMVREAQGILHQHLKSVGLKQTAQRDTILRTFLKPREHLSTDELYRLVKKKDPRIGYTHGLPHVETAMECRLAERGGLSRRDCAPRAPSTIGAATIDGMPGVELCGVLLEQKSSSSERDIGRKYHYMTTRHSFQIYGVCEDCRKKKNGTGRVV